MDIKTKLQSFREKIDKSTSFDDEFRKLVGVELYDFIQNDKALKNEFDRRLQYLKNLVSDKSFNRLQDDLFLAIQKMLKLTSLKKVQEKQVIFHNAWVSSLKTPKFDEKNGIKWLTLPDSYSLLQDKKNYYRLGDDLLDPEIRLGDIETIEKQYKQIDEFFDKVFWSELIKGKEEERKKLGALWENYKWYYYELDNLICRTPISLHLESFEKFFFNCTQFYRRPGYEWYHHDFSSGIFSRNTQQFEETKKVALQVIDDLVETIEVKKNDKKEIDEKVAEYYITKDSEGDYYQEGQLINIPNKDTLYFVVFDVVYGLALKGGEINYSAIEDNLEKRMVSGIKVQSLNGQLRNKRILRSITEFFENTKSENIAGSRKLIEPVGRGGKKIRFNNKK